MATKKKPNGTSLPDPSSEEVQEALRMKRAADARQARQQAAADALQAILIENRVELVIESHIIGGRAEHIVHFQAYE